MKNAIITAAQSPITHPMCGLDKAMADIVAGRVNHYSSLSELIEKFR